MTGVGEDGLLPRCWRRYCNSQGGWWWELMMIHTLEAAWLVEQKSNIFDESIPNDPTPVLQPKPWRPSNVTTKDKQNIKQTIKDFGEWLLNYIPPKPKLVDKVLESFKKENKKILQKDGYFVSTNRVQLCFEELCDSVSNKRIEWIRPRIIST